MSFFFFFFFQAEDGIRYFHVTGVQTCALPIWFGGNRLFKSYNRGDTWMASADLTKQIDRSKVSLMGVPGDRSQLSKNDGVTSYSTIVAISESPVLPGVVWAGTDDGNLQVSRDGGQTFTEVARNRSGRRPNNQHWISR